MKNTLTLSESPFILSLNIRDGVITYNDFDINEENTFEEQEFSYKEDILQVSFGKRYVLDVGWYPEFQKEGCFKVRAIQDYDWMEPLLCIECKTLKELREAIEELAFFLSKRNKIKGIAYRKIEYDH